MKNREVEKILKSSADNIEVPDVWQSVIDAKHDNGVNITNYKRHIAYKLVLSAAVVILMAGIGVLLAKSVLNKNYGRTSINSVKDKVSDYNENDMLTLDGTECDFVYASPNFKKLYDDSDLIIQLTASEIKYSAADGGLIKTSFIPKIKETYKGKYDGSSIVSMGGILDYDEYIKNDPDKGKANKSFTSSKETTPPKKVQLIFANVYIVHNGDTFIAFCKKLGSHYVITNGFQGLFKVDGNKIQNRALKDDYRLLKDIAAKVNAQSKSNIDENAIAGNGIDKKAFIDILKSLKQ